MMMMETHVSRGQWDLAPALIKVAGPEASMKVEQLSISGTQAAQWLASTSPFLRPGDTIWEFLNDRMRLVHFVHFLTPD
jgi:hypothetical protein